MTADCETAPNAECEQPWLCGDLSFLIGSEISPSENTSEWPLNCRVRDQKKEIRAG